MAGTALPLLVAGLLQTQDAVPAAPLQAAETRIASTSLEELRLAAADAAPLPVAAAPKQDDDDPTARSESPPTYRSRWFVRFGALGALYNSHAVFSSGGTVIPGAEGHAIDNATLSFDVGYDVTDNISLMLMGGVPPRLDVVGKGLAAPFGTLGAVRYGPVILTAVYRSPEWRGLRPYVGGGGVHAFMLRNFDGAVKQLTVNDSWGYAVQTGVEYRLARKWSMYLDYKRVWLDVKAKGEVEGFPVRGRVTLDPDVISAGLKFHFG